MIHDLIPCSLIHHFAVLHNDQLVCHVSSYTNVMGYDDDACVEIVTQFHHLTDDLRLCGHIQCTGWFVCQKQFRIKGHCHGNTHTLTHTTGKLMRITVHNILCFRETHFLQHAYSFFPRFIF